MAVTLTVLSRVLSGMVVASQQCPPPSCGSWREHNSENDLLIITEAEALNQSEPNIVFVNEAFVRHTGYQFDEAVGKTAHILHGRLTDEAAIKKIKAAMQAWQPAKVELISYKKNGEAFWQDLDLVPISDESGVFTHWILIGRDVSATKKAEDEIRHLAYYDALTALTGFWRELRPA